MATQSNRDDALNLLLAEAPVDPAADPKHAEQFDDFLTQMASADNPDQGMRAAALQLRLPNARVDVNEQGNLSFSDRAPGGLASTEAFKSKRMQVANGHVVIGNGNEVASFNLGAGANFRGTAKRAEALHSTGSRHTANLFNKLADIDGISDTGARSKALIDLSTSIDLALNDRKLELLEQAGDKYGVLDLERRLKQAEAADRADPRWDEFKQDSPITDGLRKEAQAARNNASLEADRSYMTDTLANELAGRRKQSLATLELDVGEESKGLSADDVLGGYAEEDQDLITALHKGSGARGTSAKAKLTYMEANPWVADLVQGDATDLAVQGLTAGTRNQSLIQKAMVQVEAGLVGEDRATARLTNLNDVYSGVMAGINGDKAQLDRVKRIGRPVELDAINVELTLLKASGDPSRLKDFKAGLPRRMMELSKQMVLEAEVNAVLERAPISYPSSTDPGIQALVLAAEEKGNPLGWIVSQAETPQAKIAARAYLASYWKDNYDSRVLGRSRDTVDMINVAVQKHLLGLNFIDPKPSIYYPGYFADAAYLGDD